MKKTLTFGEKELGILRNLSGSQKLLWYHIRKIEKKNGIDEFMYIVLNE